MGIKACGSWNSGGRGGLDEGELEIGDGVLKANSWKASLKFSLPTGEEPDHPALLFIQYNWWGPAGKTSCQWCAPGCCLSRRPLALLSRTGCQRNLPCRDTCWAPRRPRRYDRPVHIWLRMTNIEAVKKVGSFTNFDTDKLLLLALYLVSRRGHPSQNYSSTCQLVYSVHSCIHGSKRCLASLDPLLAACTP